MSTANKILMGAAGGAVALPSDDQFNRVSFLSHFDGSNNGVNNVFIDGHDTSSPHTITANGDVTQGSFGPFARPDGEWAVGLNTDTSVTGSGYLRVPSSGNFGTGNFTYEAWVYLVTGGGNPILLANSGGAVAVFRFGTTTSYLFGNNSATSQTSVSFSDLSAATFQWQHVALVRSSGVIKCYLNGTASSTTLSSSDATGAAEYIGTARNFTSGTRLFDGYISNVRFSDIARYTSNFTPSTAPFVSDSNTDLLTCQSNRFVDNSSSGHTITPYGSAAVTAFGPFLTSSVYSAGTNGASSSPLNAVDYLSIADGSWKTLGTGDFTWEFWFYGETENSYMIGDGTAAQNKAATFTLGVSGKRMILYYSDGTTAYSLLSPNSAPFYNLNEWHHVAYVRDGNDHKIYADGILRASETRSITMQDSTGAQHIGNFGPGLAAGADTIFSDVRLVKGTAVYSGSTYTVPTAPLTAISGTELLLNMADGQAIDSAAQNNLTLVGTAKTSTAQKKFGDASMVFAASSGALATKDFLAFGSGNFTVEFFVRFDNPSSLEFLIDGRPSATNGAYFTLYSSGGLLKYSTNNTVRITGSSALNANIFYHVAVCRSGTDTKMFVDGTQIGSTYSDSNYYLTSDLNQIGGYAANSSFTLKGYMDELRISRMARYTSNFTAPTEPFADKGQ